MTSHRAPALEPVARNTLLLSVIIPAHNEEKNIRLVAEALAGTLRREGIPFEIVVVNDNSTDNTRAVVEAMRKEIPEVSVVDNPPPNGLGLAIRCGLRHFHGDVVAVVMADASDAPEDAVKCYRKIEEGYDCVFGSRFMKGSRVSGYPPVKLVVNRAANLLIRLMFMTRHNDLTNAFKLYRRHVIESISPLLAMHFNITIEMSLSALARGYRIAAVPISWSGRTWGQSHLRLREMGRRYLCTLLKIWCERILIHDDLVARRTWGNEQTARSSGSASASSK